jgi:hypothetical protein
MRRALLSRALVVASTLLVSVANAQQAPLARPPVPLTPAATPAEPPAVTPAETPAPPVVEPPYDPAEHGGLAESVWLRATRGTARRSSGMMGTGIGLVGLGALLMGVGTGVYLGDNGCLGSNNSCNAGHGTGMAVLSAGLIAAGLGIPLTIYGATDVPRAESGSAFRGPAITVGFTGQRATLAVRF